MNVLFDHAQKIVDEDKDGEYITFILAKYDSNTK
jgi:hypothetical protein